jgi:hypothetical protein
MTDVTEKLLTVLPEVRAAFYRRGFELPRTYLAHVEASRQRVDGEHDHQYYLDEVLREKSHVPAPWSPTARLTFDPSVRSAYLDFLATVAGNPAPLWFDLNLKGFAFELDSKEIRAHRLAFIAQRVAEFDSLRPILDGYFGATPPSAAVLMRHIARDFGFVKTDAKKTGASNAVYRGDILFMDADPASPFASINLYDISAFRRQGCVMLGCFLRGHPGFAIGFSDIFPGGSYYVEDHASMRSTITSFYVQLSFFAMLRAAMAA